MELWCRRGSPDPETLSNRCHKKGAGSKLGEKDFCGGEWKQKPGLLWVGKSVGGEELELPPKGVGSALKKLWLLWGRAPVAEGT